MLFSDRQVWRIHVFKAMANIATRLLRRVVSADGGVDGRCGVPKK